jgi:predicted O-methyltransferase YrrM
MKLNPELERFILQHSDKQDQILAELERETSLKVLNPRMLSGHLQGSILTMLSKMIRPLSILEIGTYTGYSAICLAKGLQPGGRLITIEINDELEAIAGKYFQQAGIKEITEQRFGSALEILPQLSGPFDLVFIDADKKEYTSYYQMVFDKIVPGGWIIADNTLWDGKVTSASAVNDPQTRGIFEFNRLVANDHRVEKIILPIRDGISIIRKK